MRCPRVSSTRWCVRRNSGRWRRSKIISQPHTQRHCWVIMKTQSRSRGIPRTSALSCRTLRRASRMWWLMSLLSLQKCVPGRYNMISITMISRCVWRWRGNLTLNRWSTATTLMFKPFSRSGTVTGTSAGECGCSVIRPRTSLRRHHSSRSAISPIMTRLVPRGCRRCRGGRIMWRRRWRKNRLTPCPRSMSPRGSSKPTRRVPRSAGGTLRPSCKVYMMNSASTRERQQRTSMTISPSGKR